MVVDPTLLQTDTNPSQPTFTANCLVLKEGGVQGIYLDATSLILAKLAQECAQQGYHPKLQVGDTAIDTPGMFDSPYVQSTEALVYEFPYVLDDTSATEQYHKAMERYVPGLFNSDDAQAASLIWTSAKLFQDAATLATDPTTAAGILQGLHQVKHDDLGGLASQPLTYTSGQPSPPNVR